MSNDIPEVLRFEIQRLIVSPEDIVVVKGSFRHPDHRRAMRNGLSESFPGIRFMVLPHDVELSVIPEKMIDTIENPS